MELNPYEEDFQHGPELLKRYAKREGHARVPGAHREGSFRLGIWVEARRTDRRLGRLAPARAKALEAVPGWSWSVLPLIRRRRLERALTALQQFGIARATPRCQFTISSPASRPANTSSNGAQLGGKANWMHASPKRFGASRDGRGTHTEEAFRRGLERLERYVSREGHARVPVAHIEDGFKLGAWTAFKRRDYRDGRLPRYQVRAFQALPGGAWNISGTRSSRPKVRGR